MNYKIGDKVRIVKRTKPECDYPFSFVSGMAALAGQVFTIKQIRESKDDRCSINGDYHLYILEGIGFSWHSSMFEPAESSEVKVVNTAKSSKLKIGDTVRVIAKGFEEGHPLLYRPMKVFIGGIFKIVKINYHPDNDHAYCLDGVAAGWYWPASAFEKVEFPDEIESDEGREYFLKEASSDDSGLIETSDCEISANIYTESIKIIL